MPFYRFGDFSGHIKMVNTKKRPAPLQCRAPHVWSGGNVCCAMSTRLCDASVGDGLCSMPICDEHATSIGPELDLCPKHAAERCPEGGEHECDEDGVCLGCGRMVR